MNAPVFPALAPSPEQQASLRLRVLSLGAGVQSTTLALMAAHGEIGPMPDCAIFADTGWEPRAVYEHLAWLRSPNVLPFPVHIVSAGDLRADLLAGARGERWASIPAFTRTVTPAGAELPVYDEDENGDLVAIGSRIVPTERVGVGMIRRQCTGDYKIAPIRRKVRELLGIAGRRSPKAPLAEQWIGISLDEVLRGPYETLSPEEMDRFFRDPSTLYGDQLCKRGFASNHTNGINFVLGDGSVRFISTSADVNLLRNMATMSGGEVAVVP